MKKDNENYDNFANKSVNLHYFSLKDNSQKKRNGREKTNKKNKQAKKKRNTTKINESSRHEG